MLSLILMVFAFVLFAIAGFIAPPTPESPWSSRLVCFGLSCWVLAELVKGVGPGIH